VINSAYRKVLDFKENAEKILEKEKSETLNLNEFSRAILESRSFEISLQHNCIKLKCYITLEKDKDAKKKRNDQQQHQNTPPSSPTSPSFSMSQNNSSSNQESSLDASPISPFSNKCQNKGESGGGNLTSTPVTTTSGGAKKVNVEVIMKSNPFRVEENEKTTKMELIRSNYGENNGMLRFTYYVRPECEAKKFRDTNTEVFDKGRLIVFTNDFFTIYQDSATGEMNISLNEIVQTAEEQKRTEALGEKLFTLLKDRPRHRALLTNECKLNHSFMTSSNSMHSMNHVSSTNSQYNLDLITKNEIMQLQQQQQPNLNNQEDETFYTRELIHIYGQPIVPSFHKYFNYQLSNTHYGYRTLRRLLNCDILKKFVKITKEEIKSLDRVVEFVQLTNDKCLSAFQLNMTSFFDPLRFENGIVKNWLDVWYVDRLKEKYALNESTINKDFLCSSQQNSLASGQLSYSNISGTTNSWSMMPQMTEPSSCFLHTTNCDHVDSECDQNNHLWFCLQDYTCSKMEDLMCRIKDYITFKNNKSELILVHTAHPVFEYKDVLSETRRILAMFLNKSNCAKSLEDIISKQVPLVAREHIENLLNKFLNIDEEKKISGFTALFEILMILKRELAKEKNDEMKYSHFLCTLERANQEKLKMAIMQLKCVPCLNKFTTNFNLTNNGTNVSSGSLSHSSTTSNLSSSLSNNMSLNNKNMVSHANLSRLLKQMSLIVSTELQQIAIDLVERLDEDKLVKFIRLKDEFKHANIGQTQQQVQQQCQQSVTQAQSKHVNGLANGKSNSASSNNSSNSALQAATLLKQQQRQINGQLRSLPNMFSKQMDISSTSKSISTSNQKQNHIFNPYKAMSLYASDEKLASLNMPSLQAPTIERRNMLENI